MWDAARAKADAGDLLGAQSGFIEFLSLFPSSAKAPGAQLKLAYIKLKLTPDSAQEILDAFSQVRTRYPTSAEAGEALARIGYLHTKSDTRQAIKDFTDFLASNANHPLAAPVEQSLGRLYLRTGELDKAEGAFDKAAAVTGASLSVTEEAALQSGFVKIMRFYATRDTSHLPRAVDALGKLASSDRLNVRARADLGIAEATLLMRKPGEAREKYKTAAEKYADQPYFRSIALYGIACCSQFAGKAKAAVDDYAAVLAALPGSTIAEKDAAWRAIALGTTTASAQAAVRKDGAWQRLPGNEIVRRSVYERAWYLRVLGRGDEAIASIEELIAYLPQGDSLCDPVLSLLARCQTSEGGEQ
ncbi:MAG: hypothetical protein NTU88_02160 [Armatimonadetes bacterium]|nr:hypothetical protein [Armatimonadota bacterium]